MRNSTHSAGTAWKRNGLIVELLLLFFVLPGLLVAVRGYLRWLVVPLVILGGLGFGTVLTHDRSFDQGVFLSFRGLGRNVGRALLVFLPSAGVISALVYWYDRGNFLSFPLTHFRFWLLIMCLYPTVGALFQEVIFRGFFFHRYERLFVSPRLFLLVNAASFAMFHLFYFNPIAPALSFLGGLLFAQRYRQTGSLFAVAFEHALWGCFLFTVGLGRFFFSGSIR